jgi:hypothetical protein
VRGDGDVGYDEGGLGWNREYDEGIIEYLVQIAPTVFVMTKVYYFFSISSQKSQKKMSYFFILIEMLSLRN